MRSIFKYEVGTPDHPDRLHVTRIEMPSGARLLSVGYQQRPGMLGGSGKGPVLWAEVFSDGPKAIRLIRVVGTGWNLDTIKEPLGTFLGTVQFTDGTGLVFHLFDLGEE